MVLFWQPSFGIERFMNVNVATSSRDLCENRAFKRLIECFDFPYRIRYRGVLQVGASAVRLFGWGVAFATA